VVLQLRALNSPVLDVSAYFIPVRSELARKFWGNSLRKSAYMIFPRWGRPVQDSRSSARQNAIYVTRDVLICNFMIYLRGGSGVSRECANHEFKEMMDKARISIVGFIRNESIVMGYRRRVSFCLYLRPVNHNVSIGYKIVERLFAT
jgi:hypothetical protein